MPSAEITPYCAFCLKEKNSHPGMILLKSPTHDPGVYICDECIGVCQRILEKRKAESPSPA